MNITWKINTLDRRTSDGFVTTAHWIATAVDGEHTAGAYGSVGFTRGEDFTPFESLTEAQVIAWVKEQLDTAEIETNLAGQIAALKAPKTASGLPW